MPEHSVKSRPTVRAVAAACGVSAMTVSLALRNNPRIPAKTRARVQRVASRLGYRPDPQVAKLMHHLRVRRKPGYQATIAALTSVPAGRETPYLRDIMASAARRADELGYGFSVFRCADSAVPDPAMQRVLRSRGVEGVALLPLATPRSVAKLIDWSDIGVVATTYGVLAPEFHRVVPHQFGNALGICEQLARLGYRRIGLVLPAEHDLRVHHGFSAAVAWQNLIGGTEFVRPCIHPGALPTRQELARWFKREQPDVIIAEGDDACRSISRQLGCPVPGPVGFVSANKSGQSMFAGIEEQPAEIGATAIEQLAAMIQRGEKGVPAVPKVMMIDGRWVEGRSVKTQSPGSRAIAKPA